MGVLSSRVAGSRCDDADFGDAGFADAAFGEADILGRMGRMRTALGEEEEAGEWGGRGEAEVERGSPEGGGSG